jgi:hypothetical protein
MSDHYVTLQVDPHADPEVIEVAYRRLARKWHPDANASPQAAVRMQELNAAYEVLRDPARRRAYDATRGSPENPGEPPPPRPHEPARPVATLAVSLLGLLGVVVGLRFLGALARGPLMLALVGVAAYWLLRNVLRR